MIQRAVSLFPLLQPLCVSPAWPEVWLYIAVHECSDKKKIMLSQTTFPAQGGWLTFAFHFQELTEPKQEVK